MESFVEIDGWKTNIRFSAAHIMPGLGKCSQLHGHTYALSMRVYGEKDKNGVIVDFQMLKSVLREIADTLDHKMLVPEENKMVTVEGQGINIRVNSKIYVIPRADCVLLPLTTTSAENIAGYVCDEVLRRMELPKNITRIAVGVVEGFGQCAWVVKAVV